MTLPRGRAAPGGDGRRPLAFLFAPRRLEPAVAKQVLRNLDVAGLAVALARAEDEGLLSQTPDPQQHPADSVYPKYVGPQQLDLISARLPHVTVQLRTPGGAGNNKKLHAV